MSFTVTYRGLQCVANTGSAIVQYLYYTDGVGEWRKGVRDQKFVYDKVIGPLGFAGYQSVDWEEINSIAKP